MPTPKWAKDAVEQAKGYAEEVETTADSFLAKLIKPGWTWVFIGGALGLLVVAVLV